MDDRLKTPYYVFYADEFVENYLELQDAFREIYPWYHIAYSFKTNYTPAVCKLVKDLGGYAEVVSDMEYTLAKKIGFDDDKIIYNGPGKGKHLKTCLLSGGKLHLDNYVDVEEVLSVARSNPNQNFTVGVRVNFDVGNGLHSRFGFDYTNGDFEKVVNLLNQEKNIKVNGLHFHISRARFLEAWGKRIDMALTIADTCFDYPLDYIDLGSGMFGHLDQALAEQFGTTPTYKEYAAVVAGKMADHYKNCVTKPLLFTEPGTTVISKYFHLFTKITDIKTIRDKTFALLDAGFHNVGEICGLKKVPIVLHENKDAMREQYQNLDMVGYTCLEQDVVYRDYEGSIAVGDCVEILNVGGYSIVDKPPFIHPDIPIFMKKNGKMALIKRAQTFEDIFSPYMF